MTRDPEAYRHAAAALVVHHLEEEQGFGGNASQAFLPFSPWAYHGRQSIMQMNGLLQRRVLKRRRSRH